MSGTTDWEWKLREAAERVRARYDHIGRKTGAPFLAIVYPPDAERSVLREWRTLASTLQPEYSVRTVDVLEVTSRVVDQFGARTLVDSMSDPMPGSDPTSELGSMWTNAVATVVRDAAVPTGPGRPIAVIERLAALYPASGPRAVMQTLWDSNNVALEGPVILLIPGVLVEARVYRFVGQVEEFMYRGDII
ncbi:hypothetical protein AWB74_01724 [Caballeronia arvi]|uniref:Uncharacterized protein n=1 Tax=Caballeronia arvi TaxID=1777135 RepID=A0A158HFG6_9BURK|nr:hypothetical protein [Caballeronia arvi]SAL42390.1 hypothetical protein AWB74_01724 [Caballeronia arvi]